MSVARRTTPFSIILFFVVLNLSLIFIGATAVFPNYKVAPYENPNGLMDMLFSLNIDTGSLLMGFSAFAVSILGGYMSGNLLAGGVMGLLLFSISVLFRVIRWVLFGLPDFLGQMLTRFGADPAFTGTVVVITTAIEAAVWLWFALGFISQRFYYTEG